MAARKMVPISLPATDNGCDRLTWLRRWSQAGRADIVLENFKVGGLAKYGLDYDSLKQNPGLIYCSITGFGQTGPMRIVLAMTI